MKSLIEIVLIFISLILAIPSTFLLIECVAALLPFAEEITGERPANIAVLVPAHNESNYIVQTLKSIVPQLNLSNDNESEGDRLIVIADNCTDDTVNLANQVEGVTVIERENTHLRGKGYAVDFGLRYLDAQPPDVVLMIDGDCTVAEDTIDKIARLAWKHNQPVQATYLMDVPPEPIPRDMISSFALILKNSVRPKGLAKLSLPCLLTGSGMAFSWEMINKVSFANSKTVDDMQLGLDLAIAGYAPLHCHSGKVRGRLMEDKFAKSQRSRWEHGHMETLLTETPRLLKAAIIQKRFDLLGLNLELCIPPLSLLITFWFVAIFLALLGIFCQLSFLPLVIFILEGVFIFISLFTAWLRFARNDISIATILRIPFYIFWKIPLYWAFLFKRQSRWTKTERDV
jgi:cellulose synthase/poly-beta-1,6-N-acetylglucosamine synthase-like glycosyltransferase